MLSINIPVSNRRQSEEDELAEFILREIKKNGECKYFHYGVGFGTNFPHAWATVPKLGSEEHPISDTAHNNVISAFESKGYSVTFEGMNYAGVSVIIRG